MIVMMLEHWRFATFHINAIAVTGIQNQRFWKFITKTATEKTMSYLILNYFAQLIIV